MKRFYVYVRMYNTNNEKLVAEGVEFNNENIALHEFLTQTILILDSIKSVSKHYSSVGEILIEWIDFDEYETKIH